MKGFEPSEHGIQATFVDWVKYEYRMDDTFYGMLFFSVPSGVLAGGNNRGAIMQKHRKEGWHAGIPDILYNAPRGPHPYFAMEFKHETRRGEKYGGLSEDQREFLRQAKAVGAYCCIAYTVDEACEYFATYMRMDVPNDTSDMTEKEN